MRKLRATSMRWVQLTLAPEIARVLRATFGAPARGLWREGRRTCWRHSIFILFLLVKLLLIMPGRNRLKSAWTSPKRTCFLFSPRLNSLVQKCEVKCLRYGIGPLAG